MLLTAVSAAQAPPSATGVDQSSKMATPPPVSGLAYATQVGSEMRRNYVRGGLTYSTSYVDNYLGVSSTTPIAETIMSVLPVIALDASSERQQIVATYSPGFTFYEPSSILNEIDNTASVDYALGLTTHSTIHATERFQDSSSPFSPLDSAGAISGIPVTTTPGIVPPFAKRLSNSVNAGITAQTGLNEMFGVSGAATLLHYPNSAQTPGLYDSSSRGGTGFFSHRLSASQYVGVTYQFMDLLTTPTNGESSTRTSTPMGFYTIYPSRDLSFSIAGGPQYYQVAGTLVSKVSGWAPSITASMGWQSGRTSLAASYSHTVTGGGGVVGAYDTDGANATLRWQLARAWTATGSGGYFLNKSVGGSLETETGNGHSLTESATVQHPIHGQVSLTFGYDHVHQSYGQVAAIAANPDSNRVSVSITWNFLRPLGK
jgi:hypothetical protein